MMKLWKKIGLTASLAAGVGMVGAGAYTLGNSTQQEVAAAQVEQTATQLSSRNETAADKDVASTETAGSNEELSVQEVAANSMPAMVAITNTSVQEIQNYFGGYGFGFGGDGQGRTVESVSAGSGVIIGETDDTIQVITNAHVIADASELSVAFVDEAAAPATVIGSSTEQDLAVIEIKKSDLSESTLNAIKVISIGSSDSAVIGEQVVAIGNALGYGQSVSTGIISAKNRTITTQDETTGQAKASEGFLQTDAAINPGNSGGALLNMKGELIGINSAKYADESVEGMGYAIPIDTAKPIADSLISGKSETKEDASAPAAVNGGVTLGISGKSISAEYAQYYDIPEGVYVGSVEDGSDAQRAGLTSGDVITAIDGTSIQSIEDLKEALKKYQSGDTAVLTVSRSASLSNQIGQNRTMYESGTLKVTFGSGEAAQAA